MSRSRLRAVLTALAGEGEGGEIELRAPAVGLWREAPVVDSYVGVVAPVLGRLEVLGVLHDLVAPPTVEGFVVRGEIADARVPVAYGDLLVVISPSSSPPPKPSSRRGEGSRHQDAVGALILRAPTSGRYYDRPDPDSPPFVHVGDTISVGRTVCLLEVMKTFNRVNYGGEGFPERAKIIAIGPENGDDLTEGDVIVELEPG